METAADYLERLRGRTPDVMHWDWEQTLERSYCKYLPRGVYAVDVGGHAGRHARILLDTLAARELRIIEPLPEECARLRREFGARPGVRVVQSALSRQPGRAQFVVNTNAREESGLRRRRYNDEAAAAVAEIEVDVTTLDRLFAGPNPPSRLDFIKIDVEGAELDVLAGGEETVQRYRPLISVEFGSPSFAAYGREAGELFDLASRWGYRLTDLLGHPVSSRDEWLRVVDAYYWDFFMVADDQLDTLSQVLANEQWPVARPAAIPAATPEGLPGKMRRLVNRLFGARGTTH